MFPYPPPAVNGGPTRCASKPGGTGLGRRDAEASKAAVHDSSTGQIAWNVAEPQGKKRTETLANTGTGEVMGVLSLVPRGLLRAAV
jgi:hypothetical protein